MAKLSSLHILLTYRCLFECDHCFVWGSPKQQAVFTLGPLGRAIDQGASIPSIGSLYFEGGEPFLYYPILLAGVRRAAAHGLQVGLVTNGFWATTLEDAVAWLQPMSGLVTDLSVSTDLLHYDQPVSRESLHVQEAGRQLGIPVSTISCDLPQAEARAPSQSRGEPIESGPIMFRGRAVRSFAAEMHGRPWNSFDECPHEDLLDPGRVHLDPLGNLHLCQGLVMGNLFERPLSQILDDYAPERDPVLAPLVRGGPAELVSAFELPHAQAYADACHLCYEARLALRARFPVALGPGPMYGEGLT